LGKAMSVGTCAVAELAAAADKLIGVDPAVFADGEALAELCRQLERVAAAATRATGPSTPPAPGNR